MKVGDYINDLERPGAVGIITSIGRDSSTVSYTMIAAQCTTKWQEHATWAGWEDWSTGKWELRGSAIVCEARDLAHYYDAVTQ